MPPKKDAKKGTTKELDPSIYVRKPVELDEIVVDNSVFEQLAGKIASIDTLFPVWDAKEVAEEKWSEPFVSEKKIKYPKNLGVTGDVNLLKFLNLEPIEVPVDPKAKKEAKKDPKKGAVEAQVQLTEVLVDEHGRNLPVVFKELPSAVEVPEDSSVNESKAHLEFEIPRPFGRAYTEEQQAKMAQLAALAEAASATAAEPSAEAPQPVPTIEEPAGEEVDPFLCGAFRLVQRFTGIITKAHLRSLVVVNEDVEGAEKNIEDSRHVLESTFLWRAIYPQLPSGKPVYNPAGKYCVRLFLAGQWRRVFVNDSVPVTADGRPAVACSQDHLELWPLLLAKALYAVYSACGYVDVVADVLDHAEDRVAAMQSEASAAAAEGTGGEAGTEAAAPVRTGPYALTALPRAQCIAHFTSFVLHVLTGWQPRAPTSMRKMFGEEHTRALKLLEALAVEGVSTIDEDDVVRDRNEETATERAQAARSIEEVDSAVLQDCVGFEDGLRDLAEASEEDSLAHSLVQRDPSRRSGEAEYDEDDEDLDLGSVDEAGSYKRAPGRVERGAEIVEAPDDGIVRRTKQQFKTEYMRRKEHRDAVTATIVERERRIARVTQQLEALLTEAFFLTFLDPASQQVRILPVLGVSYPELYKSSLWEVQLLVHWRPGAPQETEFTANPTPEDTESAEIRGVDEGPLPRTTPLEYEWLTIRELMELDAVLLGMDTCILTPFDAVFRNPWVPLSSLPTPGAPPAGAVADKAPAAAKEKAKGKDKNAPVEAPVVEEYFADPGVLPVTLLRLNTPEFFTEELTKSSQRPPLARQSSTISVSGKHTAVKSEVRRAMRKGALEETEAALREEQYEADLEEDSPEATLKALLEPSVSSGLQPVADFLHFTVMIHADAVLEYKEAAPAEAAPQDGLDLTEGKAKPRHMLPSDVTLVLQEVRTDKVDPLMFVMEMKAASYLPLLSKSFAISTKRFRANPGQPLVFWMRLFSKASVYMHFSSEVGVSVGPAEQIWAGIGKSVFMKEGRAEATRQQTQQLVFRLPLVCDQPAVTSADAAASESKGEGEGEAAPSPAPKAVATGMTFLQVTDRGIDRFISLGLLPANRTEPLVPLPRTQGNIVQFASELSEATILLGRTFPAALFDKRASSVPAFSWRLLILSDDPIREPAKPINEEIVSQRFVGKFIANNKNALFRDIYTIDKLSFPLAFRLTTAHNRPATGSTQDRELTEKTERSAFVGMASESARKALKKALTVKGRRKDLCLSVKLYRATDMKLVSEFKGRESVICYFQSLDSFLPDGETFDVAGALAAAAAAGGAGKKDAKTPAKPAGKGAAPAVTLDTVDVLVECTLDEEAMLISDEWQSRYPHVFDCLYPDSSAAGVRAAQEAAAEKEVAGGKKGEAVVDPDEAIRKSAEVIQAQQKCLAIAPPSKTLIKWQLDVLAGKVNSISHDTSTLEKELALKNSWEDSSAGRAERSAAALKYYQERRATMQKLLEDAAADSRPATASSIQEGVAEEKASQPTTPAASSRPATGHHAAASATAEGAAAPSAGFTALAPSMAEALTTALGGDADQLNRRYTVLTNMPTQFVKVDVLQTEADDPHVSFIQPRDKTNAQSERDLLTQLQVQRTSESQRSEARHQDVAERFVRLNAECRQEAKERVEVIVKEANADAVALAALWEAREKYRLFVEAQNASLAHLLKRAADAKAVARAAEKKAADEAAALAEKLRKEEEKKAAKKK